MQSSLFDSFVFFTVVSYFTLVDVVSDRVVTRPPIREKIHSTPPLWLKTNMYFLLTSQMELFLLDWLDENESQRFGIYLKSAPREAATALSSLCFLLNFLLTHTTTPLRGAAAFCSTCKTQTHFYKSLYTEVMCVWVCVCLYLRFRLFSQLWTGSHGCEACDMTAVAVGNCSVKVPLNKLRQRSLSPLTLLRIITRSLQMVKHILQHRHNPTSQNLI